jgi:hypothetical protein
MAGGMIAAPLEPEIAGGHDVGGAVAARDPDPRRRR